jgi:hypothetical protein
MGFETALRDAGEDTDSAVSSDKLPVAASTCVHPVVYEPSSKSWQKSGFGLRSEQYVS